MSPDRRILDELRIDRRPRRPRRRRGLLVLVAAAVLAGGGAFWYTMAQPGRPTVRTAVARAATDAAGASSVLDASGYVTPRRQATVSAKITGKVVEILIDSAGSVAHPHLLVGSKSFHDREEVETVRTALTAIEWPEDELSVYATMRGSLFAITDGVLDVLQCFLLGSTLGPAPPADQGMTRCNLRRYGEAQPCKSYTLRLQYSSYQKALLSRFTLT